MERAISSLAFKGSIAEAVVEAKRQKKLFVVYISGDNPESIHLEESTWTDQRVTESLSKYCILLHILEGSTDATQFSAIYPQKSVPCIAAIGYNGVQLWQSEGFVSAEVLASSLEKAWLSLHIQETTATFLTAALASGKAQQPASGASDTASFERGSSSRSDVQSPSKDEHVHSSETTKLENPELVEQNKHCEHPELVEQNKHCEHAVEDINSKPTDEVSPASVLVNQLGSGVTEEAVPSTVTVKEPLNPVKIELNNTGVGQESSSAEDICPASEVVDQHSGVNMEASGVIHNEGFKPVLDKKAETVEAEKTDILDFSRSKSNDVHLNIRLPNGASLQRKFSVMSTLRMVKYYVDENQDSSVGSYDLAIPYPRKVFNDQDLRKTLSELDLFNRQALIVVPHHRPVGHDKAGSSLRNQMTSNNDVDSSNGSTEGYFAFMKRIVSYVNPFSYLGGGGGGASSSSGPVQESRSNMWQYSPNHALQNNLRSTERAQSGAASASGVVNSTRRQQTTTDRFGSGSNIHTLKRDEDEDDRFSGKNAFWNGNSTQYGGDNDAK